MLERLSLWINGRLFSSFQFLDKTWIQILQNCAQFYCATDQLRLLDPPGVLPYSLGGGVQLGSQKSYPLQDQILWLYTRLKMLNCSWFQYFVSNPVKWDPILDQFSMITRPYTVPDQMAWKPYPFQRHIPIYPIYRSSPLGLDLMYISLSIVIYLLD